MSVAETVLRMQPPQLRLIKAARIVVRRLFDTDDDYVLQSKDREQLAAFMATATT
jgi:hypothetical protein